MSFTNENKKDWNSTRKNYISLLLSTIILSIILQIYKIFLPESYLDIFRLIAVLAGISTYIIMRIIIRNNRIFDSIHPFLNRFIIIYLLIFAFSEFIYYWYYLEYIIPDGFARRVFFDVCFISYAILFMWIADRKITERPFSSWYNFFNSIERLAKINEVRNNVKKNFGKDENNMEFNLNDEEEYIENNDIDYEFDEKLSDSGELEEKRTSLKIEDVDPLKEMHKKLTKFLYFNDHVDTAFLHMLMAKINIDRGTINDALLNWEEALYHLRDARDIEGELEIISIIVNNYDTKVNDINKLEKYRNRINQLNEIKMDLQRWHNYFSKANEFNKNKNYNDALKNYSIALQIAESVDDNAKRLETLTQIAEVYSNQQQYDDAIKTTINALHVTEDMQYVRGASVQFTLLAKYYGLKKEFDTAISHGIHAIKILSDIDEHSDKALVVEMVAELYGQKKEYDKSIYLLSSVLDIFKQSGKTDDIERILQKLSNFKMDEVYKKYQEKMDVIIKTDISKANMKKKAENENEQSNEYFEKGKLDNALKHANNALTLYEDIEDLQGKAITLSTIAMYNRKMGNIEEGYSLLNRALELFRTIGDRFAVVLTENTIRMEKEMDASEKEK